MTDHDRSDLQSTPPTPPPTPPAATKGPQGRRAGGIVAAPRGQVAPVFTVTLTMVYLNLFAFVFLPYLSQRGTESYWGTNAWLGFGATATLVATIFGIFAAVAAERRGHSAWWYLSGQLGVAISPVLALGGMGGFDQRMGLSLIVLASTVGVGFLLLRLPPAGSEAAQRVPPITPMLERLGRFWHGAGNIWIGLGLLALLMLTLGIGVRWEDTYGTKSAHHNIYGAAPFGLVFLAFSASLIAATVRKYPWRVDQSGWLTVHTALVLLIVGAFLTFYGKQEGFLRLEEGQANTQFILSTDSQLVAEEFVQNGDQASWREVWRSDMDADLDPAITEPSETLTVTDNGRRLFDVTVDRYYGSSRIDQEKGSERDDLGDDPLAAIEVEIGTPGGRKPTKALLVADGQRSMQAFGNMLQLSLFPTTSERRVESFLGAGTPDLENRGELVLKTAGGQELGRVPIRLEMDDVGSYVPVKDEGFNRIRLEEQGILVRIERWFDMVGMGPNGVPVDQSPGRPLFPAAVVVITDANGGRTFRFAEAFENRLPSDLMPGDPFENLVVELDYTPVTTLPSGRLQFVKLRDGPLHWVFLKEDGERLSGIADEGDPIDLGIPLQLKVTGIWDRFREWLEPEFLKHHVERGETIRVTVSDEVKQDQPHHWLFIGQPRLAATLTPLRLDGRVFRLRWLRPLEPLGFRLHLREFHRDYYPGSTQPSSYESYLWLRHGAKFPEDTAIKVDMNNPLRLDGWRLFQARFDASEQIEATVLQVNRDPGLGITYIACVLLSLGMVIVFFQKPFMRAWHRRLKADRAGAGTMLLAGLAIVAGSVVAILPGMILIVITPEGPMLGVGVVLIIGGLALETRLLNQVFRRRVFPEPNATPPVTPQLAEAAR